MAANRSGVSNPTAKDPKLDDEFDDMDEEDDVWSDDGWEYVLREISSDGLRKEGPVIRRLCKLALTDYQNSHQAGETYEFVSLQNVLCGLVSGIEYSVTFSPKNMKNDVVETFEARGYDFIGGDELKI
ncbi:PREDICTED: uncharacterized protein LOC109176187 isoform X1 [Ipomoea nil]|uniref:uncharacterized protein LOC109176187 isoform X1 n=1 Tax=Ipomoea nil TaxID=35883 RepID=UPI0009016A07|nr:PREDICTED: uncharacterized protein LOC109176187 isoform X1 [Ipomoea nil]